ncbi:Predicted kinase, aminoglycoside phosphotransferase (APT) family [Glycomyces sambucus]|uniref:Predicted kinase, aminoglycoside phosphotransferase (APT) family n=1 Tax=Glycomyces sambucus TaxID=380244 RepID=A0A1G9FP04_9ACTN|nr:aminoglycoside phosphotransferase family protein [Glycomyces sambucus]SDK90075.1 Predicted kinase, aminoglycoside phosphotransferase (APT) family [Glycomyces sambucus]
MESITKNRQTPDALRAMIARAYGPDLVPAGEDFAAELGHGWFNVAYRIRLRDGRDTVLKVAPPPGVAVMTYERDAMAIELAALALVRERTTVPVPAVDFADTALDLCDAPYFFMPYIDADNLGVVREDLPEAEVAAYWEAIGALNAELNAITGPGFGPLLDPRHATWRAAFGEIVADVLADGERRSVDIGFDYATVHEVFAAHASSLDEVAEPRFVEWDLWPSNVMVKDGAVVCVIDHERALWGDPLFEAGFCGVEVPVFGDSDAFLRGYGRAGLTGTERVRRRLYGLHLLLVMTIETVYRGHTDPGQYDWARAQLADLMARFGHRPRP